MYSSISCSVCDFICFPSRSLLASLKSKTTRHCCSFWTNSSFLCSGLTSSVVSVSLCQQTNNSAIKKRPTRKVGQFFNLDLFRHVEPATSLLSRRLAHGRDRILRSSQPVHRSNFRGCRLSIRAQCSFGRTISPMRAVRNGIRWHFSVDGRRLGRTRDHHKRRCWRGLIVYGRSARSDGRAALETGRIGGLAAGRVDRGR